MIDLDRIAQGYQLAMTVIDDLAAALPSNERAYFRWKVQRQVVEQIEKNCIDHGMTADQAEIAAGAIAARGAELSGIHHALADIEPQGHA